ncbi:MAG: histidine kinase, partial [Clostridia bacterium]
ILSGRTDISETAILLSRFYRTALNRGNDLTQLENELNNIKAYVRLQQLLCSMGFEVLYRVDETLMQVLIPNFILQPIVENAIEHGLKNSRKDMLALCVEDNGVGMDQQTLEQLSAGVTESYGVKNVNDRLRLLYQSAYQLCVESEPDVRTAITILVPLSFFTKNEGIVT